MPKKDKKKKKEYIKKWRAPSNSKDNKHYVVSKTKDGNYECSCPHWIFRHSKEDFEECWHVYELKKYPSRFKEIPLHTTAKVIDVVDQL